MQRFDARQDRRQSMRGEVGADEIARQHGDAIARPAPRRGWRRWCPDRRSVRRRGVRSRRRRRASTRTAAAPSVRPAACGGQRRRGGAAAAAAAAPAARRTRSPHGAGRRRPAWDRRGASSRPRNELRWCAAQQQVAARAEVEVDGQLRMPPAQQRKHGHDPRHAKFVTRPHHENLAAAVRSRRGRRAGKHPPPPALARVRQRREPRLRQRNAPRRAIEQTAAELLFELLDSLPERRRRRATARAAARKFSSRAASTKQRSESSDGGGADTLTVFYISPTVWARFYVWSIHMRVVSVHWGMESKRTRRPNRSPPRTR